ncbi:MAG: hypothetical protein U0746_17655 [Gemmataceae bacterium]
MLVQKIFCPDCGVSRPASHAPDHGKLYECPGCRLLFIPAAEDVRWVEVVEERRPDKVNSSESPPPPTNDRRPSRRFRRVKAPTGLLGVYVAALSLVAAAVVVFLTAYLVRRPTPPAVAVTPPPPLPDTPTPTPAPAPTKPTEVPPPASSEPWLGDWDAAEQMLTNLGPAGVYSLSLRPGGAMTLRCRSGTDLETVEGTWRLIAGGESPRLRLTAPDAAGRPQTGDWTLHFDGADSVRFGSVAFRRR